MSGRTVRPIQESEAVQLGANFLSEGVLFAVATALLLFEMISKDQMDAEAKQKKELAEAERRAAIEHRFEMIESEVQSLRAQVNELQSLLHVQSHGK